MSCWSRMKPSPRLSVKFLLPLGLGLGLAAAPAAMAQTPPAVSLQSLGKCLSSQGDATVDSTPVVITTCAERPGQRWRLPPRGFSGPIVGPGGKCLDVFSGDPADRTPLILFSCHGLPNQIWRHEADGRIVGLLDKCLDVLGSGTADGTPTVLFRCAQPPTANQLWKAEQRNAFHGEPLLSEAFLAGLASSPAEPNRVFAAGRQHGLLRSENAGGDWTLANQGLDPSIGVEEVAVDPLRPDHVYVLQNGKLLRSRDGGRHFVKSPRVEATRLHSLVADPRQEGLLLALDGTRVWYSRDSGEYFYRLAFPVQQSTDTLRQILVDPLVPGRWWIAAAATCAFCTGPDQGVFRSDDQGATWTRVFLQPSHGLVADPRAAGQLYALVGEQVYRTRDGGASWQLLANFGSQVIDLWVDSEFPGIVLVSHRNGAARSTDGGASFLPLALGLRAGSGGQPGEVVRDFHHTGGWLFAAVDGLDGHPGRGVLWSLDLGATWELRSAKLFAAGRIADLEGSGGAGPGLWAATREGVYSSQDGGATYLRKLKAEGPASVHTVRIDPFDPAGNTLYAVGNRGAGAAGPFIWRSADRGATWRPAASADGQRIQTGGFLATAVQAKHVYLTTFEGSIAGANIRGILRSEDDGATWRPIDIGESLWLLAEHPGGGAIYAAGDHVLRSTDGGLHWNRMEVFNATAMTADGDHLYIANETYFNFSSNMAVSFSGYPLPPAIALPTALAAGNGKVYLGDSRGGVFVSADSGRSWKALDLGLPASAIRSLHLDPHLPGRLWVGTEAAGLHRALIEDPSAPLHFDGGRFTATITWKDFAGATGSGRSGAWTADSGFFWFFLPDNVEVMVKVLDGTLINGHFWVFVGSLSNVEFELEVRDEWTGAERVYRNPSGRFASFGDIEAFVSEPGNFLRPAGAPAPATGSVPLAMPLAMPLATAPAMPAAAARGELEPAPMPSDMVVTVRGRFAISVDWEDGFGQAGVGLGRRMTEDTAAFSFFSAANTELVIKVLDGTSINGHNWVFYGALSDVGYVITIRDLLTGEQAIYQNPVGQFGSVGDIDAF